MHIHINISSPSLISSTNSRLLPQTIKVNRRTDTRQVTERLRRVTHLFTGDGDFFGEHAQVVGVGEDIVEMRQGQFAQVGDVDVVACCLGGKISLVVLWGVQVVSYGEVMAYSGHGFDEPECDHDECAFAAAHAWRNVRY